jgi:putative ABC transport system permease protein
VWGDKEAMGPAFGRGAGAQVLSVRMTDPSTIPAFDEELRRNPRMQVQAIQERMYYEQQSAGVSGPLMALAIFVAIVMGVGAVFGAMNTMYAIVVARTREIGTLRALGFSRLAILAAFVIESTCLAIAGGAIGCLLALPANGISSAAGGANFAEVAFAFRITAASITAGMILAVLMGIAGGVLPSLRAARMPITTALREA